MWKFIEQSRSRNLNSILGMIINLRNVLIVAVSADPRYGPMYNFGIARVMYKSLIANGYKKKSGVPVTLIGYSGGGQMACGSATYLKRALDAPVDVISLGGVISGNDPILDLEHLFHFVGDKDNIERIGPVMFSSRWKIAVLSYWNRAKRLGSLTETSLGPVGHQVPGGMLDPVAKLPDGRTNLRQTLDYIEGIVEGRVEPQPAICEGDEQLRALRPPRRRCGASTRRIRRAICRSRTGSAAWFSRSAKRASAGRCSKCTTRRRHTPISSARRVKLRWADDPRLKERLRAVTRDVNFSAEATHASIYGGLVMPDRLNRWRLVDPLESLAGAHPTDDVIVKLDGAVAVEGRGADATLRILRRAGANHRRTTTDWSRSSAAAETAGEYRVAHFDRASGAFSGAEEIVRMPPVVRRCRRSRELGSRPASNARRSTPRAGTSTARSTIAGCSSFSRSRRARCFARRARRPLENARESRRYANKQAWRDLVAAKGDIIAAGSAPWKAGRSRPARAHVRRNRRREAGEQRASARFISGTLRMASSKPSTIRSPANCASRSPTIKSTRKTPTV